MQFGVEEPVKVSLGRKHLGRGYTGIWGCFPGKGCGRVRPKVEYAGHVAGTKGQSG